MNDDHGYVTEEILESISNRIIGEDFVIRSPQLIEKKGRRELADLLFILDDTLIIIQSKSIDISIEELNDVTFNRIKKRHKKALTQLNTTLNAERHDSVVEGTTSAGIPLKLNWSQFTKKIGIITLNLPDHVYSDPEFRFQYPDLILEHRKIQVHTFMVRDLFHFADEIKTSGDFLHYLDTRWKCLSSKKFIIGNELDFLAFTKINYDEITETLDAPKRMVSVSPGYWEGYIEEHNDIRKQRDQKLQDSIVVQNLISILRSSIEYSSTELKRDVEESTDVYLQAIGMLGKLTLLEMSMMGIRMKEKVSNTNTRDRSYFAFCSNNTQIGYLFLASNTSDREKRRNELQLLGIKMCHSELPIKKLLCIGSHGLKLKGSAIDCMIMNPEDIRNYYSDSDDVQFFQPMKPVTTHEWEGIVAQ